MSITLLDFQDVAVQTLDKLLLEEFSKPATERRGLLIIGATGTGKTYVQASALRTLFESGAFKNSSKPFPVFYITKATVVKQTQDVLYGEFGLPPRIFTTNYDQMRSTIGDLFISWQEKYSRNLTDKWLEPVWRQETMPDLIFADECQALRNPDSLQSKIITEYIKQGGLVVFSSATPFTRICEARTITLGLRPKVEGFGYIKSLNWEHFANVVSGSRSSPQDINHEATKRLTDILEDRIIRFKNVKFKKRTFTHCKLIDFRNHEDRSFYLEAYEDYLKELAAINRDEPNGVAKVWVAQKKFQIRAEVIKAPYLAEIAFEIAGKGKQIILASNYIKPLSIIKDTLINKFNVLEDEIAIIKGGQSREVRQENIKRFQTGKAKYCILTLRSGGVGLSLHHNPKNQDTCKPRYVVLPPTWSAVDLVQALGRAHRINSISTTYQDIVWFRGTIEEDVAQKVARKLRSLKEVVSSKESWSDLFSKRGDFDIEKLKQHMLTDGSSEEVETNEDDSTDTNEFAVEAYENPTSPDELDDPEKAKELEFELVKDNITEEKDITPIKQLTDAVVIQQPPTPTKEENVWELL